MQPQAIFSPPVVPAIAPVSEMPPPSEYSRLRAENRRMRAESRRYRLECLHARLKLACTAARFAIAAKHSPDLREALFNRALRTCTAIQMMISRKQLTATEAQVIQAKLDALQALLREAKTEPIEAPIEQSPLPQTGPVDDLTDREREVLIRIAEGDSTKAVASRLGISVKTAACHRYRIMDKLDIHDTAKLVRFAIRHGLTQV
jgi:DNA-binding CsgD family transcriptional regulator